MLQSGMVGSRGNTNGKSDQTDCVLLFVRFLIGGFLGAVVGILLIMLPLLLPVITFGNHLLTTIAVIITVTTGVLSAIWGDRFIIRFMRVFKVLRWFPL
jgi:cytochrome c biogenesis protein CcdA